MRFLLLISFIFCVLIADSKSATIVNPASAHILIDPHPKKITLKEISVMKIRDLQKITGKRLTIKEKIAFKLFQLKLRKELKRPADDDNEKKAKTALTLGIIGLCVLFIPYVQIAAIPLAILAIIKGNEVLRADGNNRKARTAVTLGWVTLALILVFLIIILLFLASFSFSFE